MGNMDICDCIALRNWCLGALFTIGSVGACMYSGSSLALDWRLTPSLSAKEVFSDNLTLSQDNK
jgi:hypothetical protein